MRNQTLSRRVGVVMIGLAASMAVVWHAPAAPSLFTTTEGFATKTGFRGVFAWEASQPVKALVSYGTSPEDLGSQVITVPGAPDSAGMALADGLEPGRTYYWQVEDLLTGERSEVSSFTASNAYNDWNGSAYTLDLLVQLDSESLPPDVPWDMASQNIAAGINIFAERLYDAMDGFARLGNVIITDTETDYAGSVPFVPGTGCEAVPGIGGNLADVLIQTTVPFDSHTYGGWAISEPCTSFYVGRLGQLVVPWGAEKTEDLHFGYVATHEMMHYAFAAPDLYYPEDINTPRVSGCWNLDWDGSLMHNDGGWNGKRWEFSELDRNPDLTPCDHSPSDVYTWEELRERYTQVPERADGPIEHIVDKLARGNEDGGALDIKILDRTGPVSSLETFAPDDTNPPPVPEADCTNTNGPLIIDPKGDANTNLSPPEAGLDITDGALSWDASAQAMTFTIGVDDVEENNPETAPEIAFNVNFTHDGQDLYVEGYRGAFGQEQYVAGVWAGARLHLVDVPGEFDPANDTVRLVLPNSSLEEMGVKPFATGDRITAIDIVSRRGTNAFVTSAGPAADTTEGACDFVVGTGTAPLPPPPPPPPPPSPDVELRSPDLRYEWQGSRSTNFEREPLLGEEVFGCEGLDGPGCEDTHILLGPSTVKGNVTISIEGENPNVNDFDVYIYGPDRREVARSGDIDTDPGIEQVTFEVKKSGVYTVSVHAWLTFDAAYSGVAELSPPVGQVTTSTGQTQNPPHASPSPTPAKKKAKGSPPPPETQAEEAPEVSSDLVIASPAPRAVEAPPVSPPVVASPESRTKGVSTTTGIAAGAAVLLAGLAAGFTLARRR